MSRPAFPYALSPLDAPRLGLIVLQADETIEGDMRRLLPDDAELMVSRVPSGTEVSSGTLAAMEAHLADAAALFPEGVTFAAVGYGCTSGTAQIGAEIVAARVRSGSAAQAVTDPLSSLVAACRYLGLQRLALLSPYVAEVSVRLQSALDTAGIATPVFGSFEVAEEATVVRIGPASIMAAVRDLVLGSEVEAVFLSCTNLRTLEVIAPLEAELGVPVLASNQVLAWHMMHLAGITPPARAPGRLFAS